MPWRRRILLACLLVLPLAACQPGSDQPDDVGGVTADEAPAVVRMAPGQDLEGIVEANPPGTTYLLTAGIHRGSYITPDDGDTFLGEPGTIISGADPLDPADFERVEDRWVLPGRTEEPFRTDEGHLHGSTIHGFARDAANHDLWWDDVRLQHVETLADLDAADEWFFDYDDDLLWVAADPQQARAIELAVVPDFLRSSAADVTIRGMTITRFATPAQSGAIHADGPRWTISDVTVSQNHGAGVVLREGGVLRDSVVVDNGQLGVGASGGAGIVVRDTEVGRNGVLAYRWGWERGGIKFKGTQDAHIIGNHVHDNGGPGIWFDLDNDGALIEGNRAIDNDVNGIFYEVSTGATIRGNEVRGNGLAQDVGTLGAGIFISISSDVVIEGNTVIGNYFEIIVVHADRTDELGPGYEAADVVVRDNDMTITREGGAGLYVDTDETEYYTSRGIRFTDNRYVLDGCERCFRWADGHVDLAAWQAAGNDPRASPVRIEARS